MRYVPLEELKPGMMVGKAFYGHIGGVLLQKGFPLTPTIVSRLNELQYSGLYIEDEFSSGIEIQESVSGEVRNNVTEALLRLATNIEIGKDSSFEPDMKRLSRFLNSLLDELISSNVTVYNLVDIKEFDLYTYQHSVNVCVLSCLLGIVLNLRRSQLYDLAMAAVLHDVGKIYISKEILNKPGKLTDEEFNIIRQHPKDGYEALQKKNCFPGEVLVAILQHHERWDGSGYIDGRKGKAIHQYAQIISVVDVYDAITSKRPYHDSIIPSEAYEYILGNAGQAFSAEIVHIFTKKIAPFPLGMQVQLSTGETGIVYKNYQDFLTRPVVRLNPTREHPLGRFLDLKNDGDALNVTIKKIFV